MYCYFPVGVLAMFFAADTSGMLGALTALQIIDIQCITYSPYGIVFFYMLQTRELRWFFEKKASVEKQEQLTRILDSQSDAIIVVNTDGVNQCESEQEGPLMYNNKLPEFLFCNSKSVELFGDHLGELTTATTSESREKSVQLLELPQFV